MTKRFAFVIDDEVFMTLAFSDTAPHAEMWAAGLSSEPKVIDYSELDVPDGPLHGWIWDGTTIRQPE
jgi:hypothetical protein